MSAFVSIVLTHRRSGIGCDELERGRVAGSGGHNDGVLHRAVLAKRFDDLRNGGFFLANRDVNTDYAAVFLIDYSIDRYGGLADVEVFAHDGHTHIVLFEVEGQSEDVSMRRRELKQFHRHALFDSVNAGNTVAYGEHPSGLAEINLFLVILDLLSDDLADFFCSDFH